MPNPIKYTTGSESLALKKGNFYIGTGDVGKGPTSTTGYYDGITPPSGGYTIYLNKATGGPSIYAPANDAELVTLTNKIAGTTYTTVNECFNYYNGQSDKMILDRDYEGIITDGLIMNLDAGFIPSYPRNGNTCYDLSGSGNNGTLVNGVIYKHEKFVFDGVDDKIETAIQRQTWNQDPFTISAWFMWTDGGSTNNYSFFELCKGSGNDWGLTAVQRTNRYYFYWIGPSNSGGHSFTSSEIKDNVPINMVITFDGNGSSDASDLYDGTKIYLNGVEMPHYSLGAGSMGSVGKLFVGGNSYPFKGEMYNFSFYDRVLSQDEVLENYAALKTRHEFTFTIDTTQPGTSNSDQFTLPLDQTGTEYDFVIDWGDGQTDTITQPNQAEKTHTYTSGGQYEIKIFGICKGWVSWNGGDAKKMLNISNWGCLDISTSTAFAGCTNLTSTASDAPRISTINLTSTFYNCAAFNGYVNNWDVSGVTVFNNLFWNADLFNRDLFNWDVSNATSMIRMFRRARDFNKDIGNWDVSKVTTFQEMFHMASDFDNGGSDGINNWNIKTGSSVNMQEIFKNATVFNQPIGNWDVSWVTNMLQMFNAATSFNQDITGWNVGNVRNMQQMFGTATVFNQDISGWNTTNVTNMHDMFYNSGAFDQDISSWDINQVTDFADFLRLNTTFTTANYDQLLIGWEAQAPVFSGAINFGTVQYTLGGAAETARDSLINTYGWTISDGGGI